MHTWEVRSQRVAKEWRRSRKEGGMKKGKKKNTAQDEDRRTDNTAKSSIVDGFKDGMLRI